MQSFEKDNRKQSLYFNHEVLSALAGEAQRLDRSMSWVAAKALTLALPTIRKLPGPADFMPRDESPKAA